MNSVLKQVIENKKILILGFGREGKSSLNAIIKVGGYASVCVSDSRDVSGDLPENVSCVCGEGYLDCLNDYDVVFKSPGVVLPKDIGEYRCSITSQTEIFIERFKNQVIGITGTKGKSTTSSLLNHVLKESGKEVLFAGNIGIPVFEISEMVTDNSIIVLELSCHQLEYAQTAPHRAVLLNIYEDHLDHYGTREKYAASKMNIYLKQNAEDYLYTTRETVPDDNSTPSAVRYIGLEDAPIKDLKDYPEISLRGTHNLLNAAFVYVIAKEFGIEKEQFIQALKTFETLPHRLQYIKGNDGVDYYDDSISTTVKSAISAVESIDNAAVILIGGMERNIEYEELCEYLSGSKIKHIICMYESGKRFYEMYVKYNENRTSYPNAYLTDNLESAVRLAKEKARVNEAVILSPAAASYGYFKNFEERGDVFQNLVKNT